MNRKINSQHITHFCYTDTPLGQLLLAGCEKGLRMISFPRGPQSHKPKPQWQSSRKLFTHARHELDAYFEGRLHSFTVPVVLEGSPFQRQVWTALCNIPYGEMASYGDIAKAVDNPGAARAVGGANNANPVPIIVPCHRVIGADKSLTGFGSGLPTKKYLLALESSHAQFPDRLL